jgi:hypothetical protein
MRPFVVFLSFIVLGATSVPAQEVPALSMELTGGSARHTDRTAHVYYKDAHATFIRVGGTVRLWKPSAVAPVLTYEYSTGCGLGWGCGDDAVCYFAPDKSCLQDFDDPKGNAISLGVSGNYRGYASGTVSAGTAWYFKPAKFLDANVGLQIASHLAIVMDARHIVTTDERGDRVWLFPISFGLRVQ